MDRRQLLRCMCAGGAATFASPLASFARMPGRGKLVFVLLRGGFDGLAGVVPIGDRDYESIRGRMAFNRDALSPLNSDFALAPGLAGLDAFWGRGELVPLQAMAIPYRTRSHFDGQAVLETGLDRPVGASDGWLNRLLQVSGGETSAVAVAAGLPRSLSGPEQVLTWSPTQLGVLGDEYVERLHLLYREDPRLADRFEAALQLGETVDAAGMGGGDMRAGSPGLDGQRESGVFTATAKLMSEPGGPNIAAVEFGGWDTHANQGMAGGLLDRRFGALARGLTTFREAAGAMWQDTTVVVMTEFGRTAQPNGTGGTDHGTAGAGFVIGPNVRGNTVLADWPGLGSRDLYEGRDLRPTLDTRAVLKSVTEGVFDLTAAQTDRIFPDSTSIRPVTNLMR
ncbi:MAG: DUF1501 domain-containing protein [Acidobacteria bacterium]|nr:DUF1501 domain-containing protein [Acidobacteriota bacterium]